MAFHVLLKKMVLKIIIEGVDLRWLRPPPSVNNTLSQLSESVKGSHDRYASTLLYKNKKWHYIYV